MLPSFELRYIIIVLAILFGLQHWLYLPQAQAAPLQTGCTSNIAHSNTTEHRMQVCGGGEIANWYQFNLNGIRPNNALSALYTPPSTLALHFNEHPPHNQVDVGLQQEFQTVTPLVLHDPSETFIGFDEESETIYRSTSLDYQITQRTFTTDSALMPWTATDSDNWLLMEFMVENIGQTTLTGGKLLYLLDSTVGTFKDSNKGFYNANKQVFYQTHQPNPKSDFKNYGFAMGLGVKTGTLIRAGLSITYPNYLSDTAILAEMTNVSNVPITNTNFGQGDATHWLIFDLPTLAPGQSHLVAVGMCGTLSNNDSQAATVILNCFDKIALPVLDITKTSPMTTATVNQSVSFTFNVKTRYNNIPVSSVQVEDSVTNVHFIGGDNGDNILQSNETWLYTGTYLLPMSLTNSLISTATVRGQANGLTIGRIVTHSLNIATPMPTLTPTETPLPTLTPTETPLPTLTPTETPLPTLMPTPNPPLPTLTPTPNPPLPTLTPTDTMPMVTASPTISLPTVTPSPTRPLTPTMTLDILHVTPITIGQLGQTIPFTLMVTTHNNDEELSLSGVVISDNLMPLNLVRGDDDDEMLEPFETWLYTGTYQIPHDLLNSPITHTATVHGQVNGFILWAALTDTLAIDFRPQAQLTVTTTPAITARVGQTVTYFITATHNLTSDNSPIISPTLSDTLKSHFVKMTGDINHNNQLDRQEIWQFEQAYFIPTSTIKILTNTITLTGFDKNNELITHTLSHTLTVTHHPQLNLLKTGPITAMANSLVEFQFEISHAIDSDFSAVKPLTITDDKAGLADYIRGDNNNNQLLEVDETWFYTASYLITPSLNPITNQGIITAVTLDDTLLVTNSNIHTTTVTTTPITPPMPLAPQPKLTVTITSNPPLEAQIGQTIRYSFTLSHSLDSDHSPVYTPQLTSNLIGSVILVNAGNGDNQLDYGENWLYTMTYLVPPTASLTLTQFISVTGYDDNNNPVMTQSSHILAIDYHPTLTLSLTAPDLADYGQPVPYQIRVSHAPDSDSSPICNVTVNAPELNLLNIIYPNCLTADEQWLITAPYTPTLPHFTHIITVTGVDIAQNSLIATATHTVKLTESVLLLSVITSPMTISVGNPMYFTVTVSQSANQAPINQLQVTSNLGQLSRLSRQNLVSSIFMGSYTPSPTDAHIITLSITVTGQTSYGLAISQNLISPLTIWHNPVLTATMTAQNELEIFHATESDNSPVTFTNITCPTLELSPAQSCRYTMPLGNSRPAITIIYIDKDNEIHTLIIPLEQKNLIYLPTILNMK